MLPSGTVTFLFTDIVGSTARWESNPTTMRTALADHYQILDGVFSEHGGHVFKTIGDAYCVAFHSAEDAAAAAQMAHDRLAQSAERLTVRIGLHTGSVEPTGGDYFGPTVNKVARIQSVAHGGQTLMSEATKGLLSTAHSTVDLGSHTLKDLLTPTRLWQLGEEKFPEIRSIGSVPNNLPTQATTFVARDKELDLLAGLAKKSRMITVTGTGGTGKTRLSLQYGAENIDLFPDGVWLCELAAVLDRDEVLQVCANLLGVPDSLVPLEDRLAMKFAGKSCLVILDNCEHVLEATAQVADILFSRCTTVTVLATSREPLGLPGEVTLRIPSLSVPDHAKAVPLAGLVSYGSTALFLERLKSVAPTIQLVEEDAATISGICRRLDGIPLAIELASARGRAMSLGQIEKRLDDRFRLLTGGSRNALNRQQTLRALIDWSVQLLNEKERHFLFSLSVFGGGWGLEAAEHVCAIPERDIDSLDVLDLVTALVDKSLVVYDREKDRYRLLETIRQYALESLERDEFGLSLRDRHAQFFLPLADGVVEGLPSEQLAAGLRRFSNDYENFCMAVEWISGQEGNLEATIRWTLKAHTGFWSLSRPMEFLRLLAPLVNQEDEVIPLDLLAHAKVVVSLTKMHAGLSEGIDEILSAEPDSLDIFPLYERITSNNLTCYALFRASRFEEALARVEHYRDLARKVVHPRAVYLTVVSGLCKACLGRYEEALIDNAEALTRLDLEQNIRGGVACQANNVLVYCCMGDTQKAIEAGLLLNRRSTPQMIYSHARSNFLLAMAMERFQAGDARSTCYLLGGYRRFGVLSGLADDPLDRKGTEMAEELRCRVDHPNRERWLSEGDSADWERWLVAVLPFTMNDLAAVQEALQKVIRPE